MKIGENASFRHFWHHRRKNDTAPFVFCDSDLFFLYNSGDKILKDGTIEGVTNNSSLGFIKLELVNGREQPSSFSGEKHFVENGVSLNIRELELSRNDGEWTAFCENTRNQTVSVSDISNSVYISKVAPSA